MRALLDTSAIIDLPHLTLPSDVEAWAVSAVSFGELEAGVLMATDQSVRAERLRQVAALSSLVVLDVDRAVAGCYAELRAAVGRRPSNDLWIAATALAHGLVLITADERQASLPLVRTALVS
ncbi:hypothetical protein/tRNA(fMet)-specific endonuclease VapC [Quadrisphaera granulorum]|uniref:Ribonuclease VapC n=1 Tax=Quadrisphaera granulorum TaxID=317664 RepID=A0A316AHG4_9ACTN|nr:tRNA(fMet)-specific endonuclease VapC [Quadrisphaera granulorum]SZE95014.1 hypothetical protein/tRNA(fMet)-specific endonuclease VapC [Quadrisphaera granulorum]